MKWISALFISLWGMGLFFSPSGFAQTSEAPRFYLHMEDGSLRESCKAQRRPSGGPDWMVTCGDQTFAVHLLVNKYPVAGNALRYQILYWVLDYNDRPDSSLAGTHHGSNLSFTLPVNCPQQELHLGQVVQTVWNLDVQIPL